MATGGGNGETSPFFELGEIRLAKDSDFQHFTRLVDNNEGWTQKLNKNGLVVWSKETANSSIKMMKVRGEIEDVPAATVFDMLLDGDYRKMWDENVIEDYELCALDSTNDVGYYSLKCPGPLRNRDFVNQRSWRFFGGEYIVFNHSIPYKDLPPRKNYIRGISYITGFVIRANGGGAVVTYLTQSDPKGKIPKWAINFVINKAAPSIFRKLCVAASNYREWKSNNRPDYMPWRYPDQNPLPIVDVRTLQQQSADSVPLLGGDKGPKDDRGEEEDEEMGEEPSSEGADR